MTQCKGYPICGCVDGSCGEAGVENAYKHCTAGKKVMKEIKEEINRKNRKLVREINNSLTINHLTDVGGAPRKLNVHLYRCGTNIISAGLNLAIIDHKGKYLASVHLGAIVGIGLMVGSLLL